MHIKLNILLFFLLLFFIFYLIFGVFLFFNQKNMLYFPDNQDFNNCPGFLDYEKINHNGTRFYYQNVSNDDVIVYYHGNAGSACDRARFRSTFEKTNKSLIFVEYAGYSDDKRKPSKDLILNDVRNIDDFIRKSNFKNIFVYGQSLGSGAASYHTNIGKVNHIILVSPFSSIADVAQSRFLIYPARLILTENFDNVKWLEAFDGNIIFFHGDRDRVVPQRFSKKLYETIHAENKSYVLIEDYGHNDTWNSEKFKRNLVNFIKNPQNQTTV